MSKEQFHAYVKVQRSGKYNMIMDANKAAAKARLSMNVYMNIIDNYEIYLQKFGELSDSKNNL